MKPSRSAFAAAVLALFAVLAWSPPAAAHGTGAKITVNHDGRGSVWVSVIYDDGHPADQPVDATLTARDDGGLTIDPAKLVQSSQPGTLVYMSTLPAGAWRVAVEFGPPIARVCEATFQVGTSNNTQSVPCVAPGGTPSAQAGAAGAQGGDGTAWLLIGVAVVGGLGCVVVALLLRRRSAADRAAAAKRPPARPRAKARTGSRS